MEPVRHPDCEGYELTRVHWPMLDDLQGVLARKAKERPEETYELYRVDIYSKASYGTQPEFTVELLHLPEEHLIGIDWDDGLEWVETDDLTEGIETWLDHHLTASDSS